MKSTGERKKNDSHSRRSAGALRMISPQMIVPIVIAATVLLLLILALVFKTTGYKVYTIRGEDSKIHVVWEKNSAVKRDAAEEIPTEETVEEERIQEPTEEQINASEEETVEAPEEEESAEADGLCGEYADAVPDSIYEIADQLDEDGNYKAPEATEENEPEAEEEPEETTESDPYEVYADLILGDSTGARMFYLNYLDGNSIPELFLFRGDSHADGAMIYTIAGGHPIFLGEQGSLGSVFCKLGEGLVYGTFTNQGMSSTNVWKQEGTELIEVIRFTEGEDPDGKAVYEINDEEVDALTYEETARRYDITAADYISCEDGYRTVDYEDAQELIPVLRAMGER